MLARFSGSQVCVGHWNPRAEPILVLRRAPTFSYEKRQQRVGQRALSRSDPLLRSVKERPRESERWTVKESTFQDPSSHPQESPTQGLISYPHGQTVGDLQTLYLTPLRQSGGHLASRITTHRPSEATENQGTGLGSSQERPKDPPLPSRKDTGIYYEDHRPHAHASVPKNPQPTQYV